MHLQNSVLLQFYGNKIFPFYNVLWTTNTHVDSRSTSSCLAATWDSHVRTVTLVQIAVRELDRRFPVGRVTSMQVADLEEKLSQLQV